jgi:hypothetical protein
MSTVQRINFEPLSDILLNQRRDYSLADPNLADPLNTVALVDGEWMVVNDAFKLERATDVAAANGTVASRTSYVNFMERGRYDRRAMSGVKNTVIQLGDYIADTRIFDATQVGATNGVAITFVGQPLQVATITIGTRKYVGLIGHDGAAGGAIVGRVMRLPANNGGKLMFERASSI